MFLSFTPDLLVFQRQSRLTANLKTRVEQTSREAVTGKREDITTAVHGAVGDIHLLQKALDDIEQGGRINDISGARLDLMTTSLASVRGVVGGLDTQALAALTTPNSIGISTISQQSEANLRSVISLLNTSHGNRKLFSGDTSDKLPLATAETLLADVKNIMQTSGSPSNIKIALNTYFNDPNGGFATNIYKGGSNNAPPSFLSDGSKIEFSVRADDQSIRETLRGLAVLATAQSTGFDVQSSAFNSVFTQGASSVSQGKGGLIKLESGLGIYSGLLENANTQQQAEKLTLAKSLNSITGRDQFEAAAELKQLQTELESSYLITSRLANLHLTNFLR